MALPDVDGDDDLAADSGDLVATGIPGADLWSTPHVLERQPPQAPPTDPAAPAVYGDIAGVKYVVFKSAMAYYTAQLGTQPDHVRVTKDAPSLGDNERIEGPAAVRAVDAARVLLRALGLSPGEDG